jgi:predicted Zn-dependent peptidase
VLGDGKAVARADRASVRRAVQHRLVPNLATLVITGRFELAATKRMVERYFGWMPMRHGVTPFREHGMLYARAVERIVRAPLRQVVVAYQTPPFDLTADVAAYLLANGRDARLQALVARGLATDVRGEVRRGQVGELRIVATPAPGVDPRVLATAIRDEAGRLSERASDDEADAALWRAETDAYLALENLAVRAELFGTYAQQSRHASLLDAWPRGSRPKSGFGIKLELAHMLSPSGAVTVIGSPEAR